MKARVDVELNKDIPNQRVANLVTEQASKLGTALPALRKIVHAKSKEEAINIAVEAIGKISNYGKNPKDL